jgi:hypothetical protein
LHQAFGVFWVWPLTKPVHALKRSSERCIAYRCAVAKPAAQENVARRPGADSPYGRKFLLCRTRRACGKFFYLQPSFRGFERCAESDNRSWIGRSGVQQGSSDRDWHTRLDRMGTQCPLRQESARDGGISRRNERRNFTLICCPTIAQHSASKFVAISGTRRPLRGAISVAIFAS